MIEWRVDAFEGVESLNAVRQVLKELASVVKETILVFTFRSNDASNNDTRAYLVYTIADSSTQTVELEIV